MAENVWSGLFDTHQGHPAPRDESRFKGWMTKYMVRIRKKCGRYNLPENTRQLLPAWAEKD